MFGILNRVTKLALPLLLVVTSAAQGVADQRSGPPRGRTRLVQDRDGDRSANRGRRSGFPGRRGFGRGEGSRRFSDEQLDSVLEFIKEHFSERHNEISALRENNPDMFRRRASRMFPRIMRIMERSERNPEAGALMLEEDRLGFQIHRLVEHYFDTDDSDRIARLRGELRELVTKQFDTRQRLRALEVRKLERRLEAIRAQLERDADRRLDRINDALDELGIGRTPNSGDTRE